MQCISHQERGTTFLLALRVATVREKYRENEFFFQVRVKSGNFVDGQGNLERTWKVREFENNWVWQADFRKFIYFIQEEKRCMR